MSSRTRQLAEVDGEGVVWGGIGFAASLIVGVALSPFRSSIGLENVVIVYLAVVALTAAIGGRAAGLVSELSAALSYNFFFTTPYYTLRIDSAGQVITVVLLFTGGLLASLGGRAGRRASVQAREEADAIRLLHAVTLAAASGQGPDRVAAEGLLELLGARSVQVVRAGRDGDRVVATAGEPAAPLDLDDLPHLDQDGRIPPGIFARWAGPWCCQPKAPRLTWSATSVGSARWWCCRPPTTRCCAPPGPRSPPSPTSWRWPTAGVEPACRAPPARRRLLCRFRAGSRSSWPPAGRTRAPRRLLGDEGGGLLLERVAQRQGDDRFGEGPEAFQRGGELPDLFRWHTSFGERLPEVLLEQLGEAGGNVGGGLCQPLIFVQDRVDRDAELDQLDAGFQELGTRDAEAAALWLEQAELDGPAEHRWADGPAGDRRPRPHAGAAPSRLAVLVMGAGAPVRRPAAVDVRAGRLWGSGRGGQGRTRPMEATATCHRAR